MTFCLSHFSLTPGTIHQAPNGPAYTFCVGWKALLNGWLNADARVLLNEPAECKVFCNETKGERSLNARKVTEHMHLPVMKCSPPSCQKKVDSVSSGHHSGYRRDFNKIIFWFPNLKWSQFSYYNTLKKLLLMSLRLKTLKKQGFMSCSDFASATRWQSTQHAQFQNHVFKHTHPFKCLPFALAPVAHPASSSKDISVACTVTGWRFLPCRKNFLRKNRGMSPAGLGSLSWVLQPPYLILWILIPGIC